MAPTPQRDRRHRRSVRKLNTQYRGMRKTTDVLSFPFHDELAPGAAPDVVEDDDEDMLNLGDIVISMPYVARKASKPEAVESGPGVAAAMAPLDCVDGRVQLLVIHGLCHLLNYDHETEDEFEDMAAVEDRLLAARAEWLAERGGEGVGR